MTLSNSNSQNNNEPEHKRKNDRCDSIRLDLKAFIDSELSPTRRMYIKWHLSRCTSCNEEIAWQQRLGKNMLGLEDAQPRSELRARILATLPPMDHAPLAYTSITERRTVSSGRREYGLRFAFGSALCLLIVGVSVAAVHSARQSNFVGGHDQAISRLNPKSVQNPPRTTNPIMNSVGTVKSTIPVTPPDPYSAAADRMVAVQQKRDREQSVHQIPVDWKRAVVKTQSASSQVKPGETAYVGVSIAVSDLSEAGQKLSAWAGHNGAKLMQMRSAELPKGAITYAVSLPSASSTALLSSLTRIGSFTGTVSASAAIIPGISAGKPTMQQISGANVPIPAPPVLTPAIKDPKRVSPAVPTEPVPIIASSNSQPTGSTKKPGSSTIVVLVQFAKNLTL